MNRINLMGASKEERLDRARFGRIYDSELFVRDEDEEVQLTYVRHADLGCVEPYFNSPFEAVREAAHLRKNEHERFIRMIRG